MDIREIDNLERKLQEEFQARKRQYDADIKALKHLRGMLDRINTPDALNPPKARSNGTQVLAKHQNAVLLVMRKNPAKDWSTADINGELEAQGRPIPHSKPRSTIARALKQLTDAGLVRMTAEHSGCLGNRYRLKQEKQGGQSG